MKNICRLMISFLLLTAFCCASDDSSPHHRSSRRTCNRGPVQGPPGPTGLTGPTGPTGSAGITNYASVVFMPPPPPPPGINGDISILVGEPLLFNTIISSAGAVAYNPATGQFTITESGTYEVIYGGRWTLSPFDGTITDPVVAIQLNGTEIPDTRIDGNPNLRGDGDWVSGSFLFNISASPTSPTFIKIIASDTNFGNQILIIFPSSGTQSAIAFCTIKRIN